MVCMPGIPPGDRRAQNACPIYRANRPALRHPVLFFVLLCNTLEVIMQTTLTVRLSQQDAQELDAICASTGKSRSEVVRESPYGPIAYARPCARARVRSVRPHVPLVG